MSTVTDDDTELRDLVSYTLENSGILGKIKAQLRANVYLALEEGEKVKNKSSLVNKPLAEFMSTTNGRLVCSLVREFLEFFNLDYTKAVFDPETNIEGKDIKLRERNHLTEALGLTELTDPHAPLLSEILRLSKVSVLKSESPTPTDISGHGDVEDDDGHTSAHLSLNDENDDYSSKHEENSEKSESSTISKTPEIVLKDQPNKFETRNTIASSNSADPFEARRQDSKDTLGSSKPVFDLGKSSLGDLPKSSLGNLPPLPSNSRQLPPLSQTKPNQPKLGSLKSNPDEAGSKSKVLDAFKKDDDEAEESSQEVTENIEEELDSFLNSEVSADMTNDETVKEDASLKADYMESL